MPGSGDPDPHTDRGRSEAETDRHRPHRASTGIPGSGQPLDYLGEVAFSLVTIFDQQERALPVLWDAQQAWDDHPYTTYLELRGSDGRVVLRRDDRFLPTWQRSAWPANQSMLQRRWLDLDSLNPGTSALTVQVTAGPGSAPLPVRIEPGSHFLPGAARDWAP